MKEHEEKVKRIESARNFEATGVLVPAQTGVKKKTSGQTQTSSGLKLEAEGAEYPLHVPKKLSSLLRQHLWEKVLLKGIRRKGSGVVEVKSVQSIAEQEDDLDVYGDLYSEDGAEDRADVSEYAVSIRQTGRIHPDVAS